LEVEFKLPLMRDVFETAFSAFDDLDRMYEQLKKGGTKEIVTAAGVVHNFGRRPRRFAGDADLPPGRYFTICDADTFNDHGTLRDEIYAYYSGHSHVDAVIYDPKVDTWLLDFLLSSGRLTQDDARYPFYNIVYKVPIKTEKNQHLFDKYPEMDFSRGLGVTYGVREYEVRINNVIDLRLPETQDWFVRTFVEMELANEAAAAVMTKMRFPSKRPVETFQELLPVIVSLETGGGDTFGQAVGGWLRQNGANGLVFPSSRSNVHNQVSRGKVVESKGWSFVLYADAPPPSLPNLFGRTITWTDPDHDHIQVKHVSEGSEKGSFSIRGLREWNLLKFDFERRIAHGLFDGQEKELALSEMVGQKNYQLTVRTKRILADLAEQGPLWFNDIDAADFVQWCESLWKDKVPQR